MKSGVLFVLAFAPSSYACLASGIPEIQHLYCLTSVYDDTVVSPTEVNYLLDFANKLGTDADRNLSRHSYSYSYGWGPYVGYDNNQNGGQPDRNLVINGYEFQRDQDQDKVGGLVVGLAGQLAGRYYWDKQRGFSMQANASVDQMADATLTGTHEKLTVCSNNWVAGNAYLDLCNSKIKAEKELSSEKNKSQVYKLSHFHSVPDLGVLGVAFGKEVKFSNEYRDRNYFFQTYMSSNKGRNLSLEYKNWGDKSQRNTLIPSKSMRLGLFFTDGAQVRSVSLSEEQRKGLELFGLNITQRQFSATIGNVFPEGFSAEISYSNIKSNLSYYSDEIIEITFNF